MYASALEATANSVTIPQQNAIKVRQRMVFYTRLRLAARANVSRRGKMPSPSRYVAPLLLEIHDNFSAWSLLLLWDVARGKSLIFTDIGALPEPSPRDIGILHTLRVEHRELTELLDRCLGTSDVLRREEAYESLRRKLLLHTKCEETEFYSLCEPERTLAHLMHESEDDHGRAERLISRLDRYDTRDPRWRHAFLQLYNTVGVHIVFEESQVFPIARTLFGGRRLMEMDEAYRALRDMASRRALSPRPSADTQPGGSAP